MSKSKPPSYIYIGPPQTICLKVSGNFVDVDLIPNHHLAIESTSEIFASLKASGFVSEAQAGSTPSTKEEKESV